MDRADASGGGQKVDNSLFKDIPFIDKIPGFQVLPYNNEYAKDDEGRIWHHFYSGGWTVVEPYKFCTGELVVRLQRKSGGMIVYTLESILAGKPMMPKS